MTDSLLVPSLCNGELPNVKKRIGALVKGATASDQIVADLEGTIGPANRIQGFFVIEATTNAGRPPGSEHYWCDVLMTALERKHAEMDTVREWCRALLEKPWGGLTFLSQEANGVLRAPEFRIDYLRWMLRNAAALETIADRFFLPGLGRVRLWGSPNGLTGTLGAFGATNEELRASRTADDYCAIARRVLASVEAG